MGRGIAYTRGGLAGALKGRTVVRRCERCGLGFSRYPGRYPKNCPQCKGVVIVVEDAMQEAEDTGGAPVITCISMVPRLQRIIDAGAPGAPPDKRSSRSFIVRYDEVDRRVPGGMRALTTFMEGPGQGGRYFRVEHPQKPVIICELDDETQRARLFASADPVRHLGFDPRSEFVDTDPVFERSGFGAHLPGPMAHVPGQRAASHAHMSATTPVPDTTAPHKAVEMAVKAAQVGEKRSGEVMTYYTGFRIHTGHNKNRCPRKDIQRALQNKQNAKRGLAKRVRAAKDWHRSPEGERLHRALGRYNQGPNGPDGKKKNEAIQNWAPNQHLLEAAYGYAETIDDVLDDILRKLLVIESLDILQDVEFDEETGSVYLFFDPSMRLDEIGEVAEVLRGEYKDLLLVSSPDASLQDQQAPSDWWVMFIPRPTQEGVMPPPDPRIFSTERDEPPGPSLKQQIVVQAPANQPEQMADLLDIDALMGDFTGTTAEALRRLPASIQERLAARMQRSKA